MGNSFRMQPAPTLYGENKTPVTEDLLEVGFLFAFGIIAFSFILIIPGIRGMEVRMGGSLCFIATGVLVREDHNALAKAPSCANVFSRCCLYSHDQRLNTLAHEGQALHFSL